MMAGPMDVPVLFTNSTATSGSSNVFVAGGIPQLGNWDVTRSVKLVSSNGVWRGTIGIPAATSFEYRFVSRDTRNDTDYTNSANATWEPGPNRTGSTPAGPPAPYSGKTVFYYSSWSSVSLFYSNTISGAWSNQPMTEVGPGRSGSEKLWRANNINRAGETNLMFVLTDNNGNWDSPSADASGATTNPCSGRVCVSPVPLVAGNAATITYSPAGGPIASASQVCIHLGWNHWAIVVSPDASMTAVSNTWVYSVTIPGNATQLDCVFNNCAGTWDNNNLADWHFNATSGGAAFSNYETPLDAFVVQDKEIYNYWPPAFVGTNRVVRISANTSFSPTNGLAPRPIRVYLPRGYDQNTTKRYPVLYMHDGENVFIGQYAGTFGCWYADTNANNLIRFGKMRETIIVGIDNSADRLCEYSPPACPLVCSTPRGSQYVSWIVDRVRPYVSANYRTLTDADNTGALGSSMGGLISAYMAWDWSNVFGKIGCFSSSFQVCMPFPAPPATKRPVRVYLDCGTADDPLAYTMTERDRLMSLGYVLNIDLDQFTGFGDVHNEDSWKRRSPRAFQFLFPTSDEPNTVLDSVAPILITDFQNAGESNIVTWTSYLNRTYAVEGSTNENFSSSMDWSNIVTTAPEPRFWSYPSFGASNSFHFIRVRQNTVPNWPN
jgi:predicted alpha/beta superfamily hydrolase